MAKKSAVRTLVVMTCTECKKYNYNTEKNRRNTPDRIEFKKFVPLVEHVNYLENADRC